MPNPSQLDPRSVDLPSKELHSAKVLDSAGAEGEPVRCVIPTQDDLLATDPLLWSPHSTPAGWFFPKKDDVALVATPGDGPPWIVAWTPSAAEPDVPTP